MTRITTSWKDKVARMGQLGQYWELQMATQIISIIDQHFIDQQLLQEKLY